MPFAQAFFAGYSLAQLAILLVAIAAIAALVYVALNRLGVSIPDWVRQVLWILAVAFVCILAIKMVASMF